jgi:hypothetical protein
VQTFASVGELREAEVPAAIFEEHSIADYSRLTDKPRLTGFGGADDLGDILESFAHRWANSLTCFQRDEFMILYGL